MSPRTWQKADHAEFRVGFKLLGIDRQLCTAGPYIVGQDRGSKPAADLSKRHHLEIGENPANPDSGIAETGA
jgi:hypothetical protein